MSDFDRTLFRAARRIHERLRDVHDNPEPQFLPELAWRECQRLAHKLKQAESRGWTLAARNLRGFLDLALSDCRIALSDWLIELHEADRAPQPPRLRDVYEELLALQREFAEVTCDLKNGTLTVETDSIVLEEVDLGSFEIVLHLADIGGRQPYEIVAIDAQPAISNSEVTHPHVMGGKLCEGEGANPVRQALAAGRLCDFFTIVERTLHTYNSGSAFVSLDDWNGVNCGDCGESMSEDESSSCGNCGLTVCSECESCCNGCEQYHCQECLDCCAHCQGYYCPGCREACDACLRVFCNDCLTEERCATCHESHSKLDQTPEENSPSEAVGRSAPASV